MLQGSSTLAFKWSRHNGRAQHIVRSLCLCLALILLAACAPVPQTATPPPAPATATQMMPDQNPTVTQQPATATATALPTLFPTATHTATAVPTPSIEARVDDLLASMTLEEKVGQLFLVFFEGPEVSDDLRQMIDDYHVGGLVLFGIAGNIVSLSQVAALIGQAQTEAVTHGAGVPLFIAIDQEGGAVERLGEEATVFPSQMALGATGSEDLARQMAQVTATELAALGINMNLAPVLDVNDNPHNPVIGLRSLGSSPAEVARLGTAMIHEYTTCGVVATAKHFPGHGHTSVDSHVGLPVVNRTPEDWQSTDLAPFQAAIDAGVDAIMTAHVLVPAYDPSGLPATLSPTILQGMLRQRMGFRGLILTDSMTMGAIDRSYGSAQAAVMAFQAGADVLSFGADWGHTPAEQRAAYAKLLDQVQSGAISTTRLDESVRRILLVKARYGILDTPAKLARQPITPETIASTVGTPAHRQVAAEIARRSITLVRDREGRLPIGPERSLLLVWPTVAGDPLPGVRAYRPAAQVVAYRSDPTAQEIAQIVAQAEGVDTVIVGTFNTADHPRQAQLVEALAAHAPLVVALDKPYDLLQFPEVGTYLVTYGDVPVSLDALAQVLFGEIVPHGKLPVELPGLGGQG